jgi:hypothetical protein
LVTDQAAFGPPFSCSAPIAQAIISAIMSATSQSLAPIQAFAQPKFRARRKLLSLLDSRFYFEDDLGNIFAFVKRKALTWKEDIRIYSDESMMQELLLIKARSILDFSVAFDVVDAASQVKVGALKRRGWKSILKDEWIIMDSADNEIGRIHEDSAWLAFVRRFIINIIPQAYTVHVGTAIVGHVQQNWNPFAPKMGVDFTSDPGMLEPRMRIAAIALLGTIEGRQRN